MPATDAKPEASRTVEDRPQRPLDRLRGRDVLLVVAIALGLVLCSTGGLGVFLILDSWAESCAWGLGGIG